MQANETTSDKMDWSPFYVGPSDQELQAPRPIETLGGIGDRLRAAAFAELQAREAFNWAARTYQDAPTGLREAWLKLALEEQKHMNWLLMRMDELEINLQERPVFDRLWHSLITCPSAREFALYMANAEERGQKAGFRFHQALAKKDPKTAEIFLKIAEEETAHIALAKIYF